jgi:hypothetical protein
VCESSKISDDWVIKGCHIHVDGIELRIFTNHAGGFGFAPVFSSTNERAVQRALKTAYEICLPDRDTRERWITRLDMATAYVLGYPGELASLANGRMFDFKMLKIALERWGAEYG